MTEDCIIRQVRLPTDAISAIKSYCAEQTTEVIYTLYDFYHDVFTFFEKKSPKKFVESFGQQDEGTKQMNMGVYRKDDRLYKRCIKLACTNSGERISGRRLILNAVLIFLKAKAGFTHKPIQRRA